MGLFKNVKWVSSESVHNRKLDRGEAPKYYEKSIEREEERKVNDVDWQDDMLS